MHDQVPFHNISISMVEQKEFGHINKKSQEKTNTSMQTQPQMTQPTINGKWNQMFEREMRKIKEMDDILKQNLINQ